MKALSTTKLIEVTLVLAIETHMEIPVSVSAIDYIEVHSDAKIIGWTEQELEATYKGEPK